MLIIKQNLQNIVLDDHSGRMIIYKRFVENEDLEGLKFGLKLEQKPITIFGKKLLQPRLIDFLGDPGVCYTYSKSQLSATKWTPAVLNLKKLIENNIDEQFNSGLVNFYRNGEDSMGWHADDERELGPNPIIASANFGATRKMKFKELGGDKRKIDIFLEDGDVLVMDGALQHHWHHMVPKQANVTEPRLNITFRNIIEI